MRREGVRIGGGQRDELVTAALPDWHGRTDERRRLLRIDAAYRARNRNRGDP